MRIAKYSLGTVTPQNSIDGNAKCSFSYKDSGLLFTTTFRKIIVRLSAMMARLPTLTLPMRSVLRRSAMSKSEFLVLVDDFPGSISKRLQTRQQHLTSAYDNQAIRVGGMLYSKLCLKTVGPLFAKEATPDDPAPFKVLTSVSEI